SEYSCVRGFFRIEIWCSVEISGFRAVYKLLLVMYLEVGAMVTVFLLAPLSLSKSLVSWPCSDPDLSPASCVKCLV
ncbi:hypothetical protein PGIGA_G00186880, partial [Pangasianodon gigas]|nr:hypothetical protein [Pangasianodon gigas]